MRRRTQALTLLAVLATVALIPLTGSRYLVNLATEILIYALFALSLNVLVGYAGKVSFGHAAYFAIGGYACAILVTTYDWPLPLGFAAAVVLSGFAALLIGFFCVRLTDIYFSMLTLAFAMFVWSAAFKWRSLTGGDDGFVGVALPALLKDPVSYLYFALAVVSVSTAGLWRVCHSAFGLVLRAARENSTRVGFVGVNVRRLQLTAFVISGAFAGIAGALFALYNRGIYTESAFWTESAQVLIMALLGGIYSFFGPAAGALVLYLLDVTLRQHTQYWPAILGVILLAVLLFLPDGLAGLAVRLQARSRR